MWIVMRDGWVPERCFDTAKEADLYLEYCHRNYLGRFEIFFVRIKDENKVIKGISNLPDIIYNNKSK